MCIRDRATTTHGATTIATVDDDATAAHLTVDVDGDITLDAASGNIYVKDDGGNYTPGSDYEIATKKYVDDNAGGNQIVHFQPTSYMYYCLYMNNQNYWYSMSSYSLNAGNAAKASVSSVSYTHLTLPTIYSV